jgi:hypothetical protein
MLETGALRLPPERMAVAGERCMEYTALSTGCNARRALLTALGVTARFTARPGCMARRTLRGTSNLEKKPIVTPQRRNALLKSTPAGQHPHAHGQPKQPGKPIYPQAGTTSQGRQPPTPAATLGRPCRRT